MPQPEKESRTQRVKFELRATGVKPERDNPLRSGIHTRGYLPHVKREGARYFVTFRLADSLPKAVLLKIQARRAEHLERLSLAQATGRKSTHGTSVQADSRAAIEREYYRCLEQFLDQGSGECWLRRAKIADLVVSALRHFEGERYELSSWVVMPNHIHAVVWPMPNYSLSAIVQSWKRFTARESNRLLGRTGRAFWQPESYDHWIRNDEEHARCCRYVVNNPVKARLCDAPENWKWSSAWSDGKPS